MPYSPEFFPTICLMTISLASLFFGTSKKFRGASEASWHQVGHVTNQFRSRVTPKWTVKIMEKPIKHGMIWGFSHIFGNTHLGVIHFIGVITPNYLFISRIISEPLPQSRLITPVKPILFIRPFIRGSITPDR